MHYVKALYNLGLCYSEGLGVEIDKDKARYSFLNEDLFLKKQKKGGILMAS